MRVAGTHPLHLHRGAASSGWFPSGEKTKHNRKDNERPRNACHSQAGGPVLNTLSGVVSKPTAGQWRFGGVARYPVSPATDSRPSGWAELNWLTRAATKSMKTSPPATKARIRTFPDEPSDRPRAPNTRSGRAANTELITRLGYHSFADPNEDMDPRHRREHPVEGDGSGGPEQPFD